jgi:hypothetical protein
MTRTESDWELIRDAEVTTPGKLTNVQSWYRL